ncbi:MAG TPA: gluconate 2-dehydrogenase subunit 3 family protein [Terriglobales bacterium]|nr:gluconate 2-dehydrogenase subunit 3 family protein [Terriglobales bacterium]
MSPENKKPSLENELTRREWLLRLGEITALAGMAGMVPGMATALAAAEEQSAAALPPGLYQPSPRHLIHALAARGAPAVPPGSETDYVQPPAGAFQPRFLSAQEFRVVSRLVEILLGKVDPAAAAETAQWVDLSLHCAAGARAAARRLDPLHRALAVAYYGEAQVVETETGDPQSIARAGLQALQQQAHQRLGRSFLEAAGDEQVSLVGEISHAPQELPGRRFYDLLRREAIRGYYTSRQGLAELDYKGNVYYSQCPGCEKT